MSTKSNLGETAFFIGNGINQLEKTNRISWHTLLKRISNKFNSKVDLTNLLKPFPLAFEEILYLDNSNVNSSEKVRKLKAGISEIFLNQVLQNNEIHKGFLSCGVNEIITTNYDYNLEKSIDGDFLKQKEVFAINKRESKHSLYRRYKIGQIVIRHIHGELRNNRVLTPFSTEYPEESIMIGFEHYSSYFKVIQDIIHGQKGRHSEIDRQSLIIRIRENRKLSPEIWTDLFFTHRIVIVGFSFNFAENHLWWLLLERKKMIDNGNIHDVQINNEIIFCLPKFKEQSFDYEIHNKGEFDKVYEKHISMQTSKGVAEILKSLNVVIVPINCDSFREYYQIVIDKYGK